MLWRGVVGSVLYIVVEKGVQVISVCCSCFPKWRVNGLEFLR